MVEGGGENFEDLLMGNVSETTSESDEQFAQRVAAAQTKLKKVKKDEQKDHQFDLQLAQIISTLENDLLKFVIFLIDHEIPSLTVLAFLSLPIEDAYKICYEEFHKFVEERADFSPAKLPDPKTEEHISWWWTFILAADHISQTLHLSKLKKEESFVDTLSQYLSQMLQNFLDQSNTEGFDKTKLQELLQKHKNLLFSENKN